jgi:hypothetical protein
VRSILAMADDFVAASHLMYSGRPVSTASATGAAEGALVSTIGGMDLLSIEGAMNGSSCAAGITNASATGTGNTTAGTAAATAAAPLASMALQLPSTPAAKSMSDLGTCMQHLP